MKKYSFFFYLIVFSQLSFAQSQYFGQNKPRFKNNKFKVLQSTHFELYHYFKSNEMPTEMLTDAENWYKLHQEVFKLAFIKPNPVILYNTHPDFQETTVIGGQIGEGTGGVTEGFRTRVVMPMMYSKRQTSHVLGHELVHAFQYQTLTYGSDSTSLQNIGNLPLFMVEGLAEYMSLGRNDSHTAMWMRDAVLSGDIPTIEDLVTKQYKYFPYRWGQAFWAYVTTTYGDDIIRPLFKETAIYGVKGAFKRVFNMDLERFSAKFKEALITQYKGFQADKQLKPIGKVIASKALGSEMNISPSISPDGKYIAYITTKNVLSLDILIVDAESGKVVRKIGGNSFSSHIDSFGFIETSGAWSPDSKHFAIVIQSKGFNKLLVFDVFGNKKKEYTLKSIEAFSQPAWSPNGNHIVVSGQVQGKSDLFLFNLKTNEVHNLTNDDYSDFQPSWSPNGDEIYFVSDRGNKAARLAEENFAIAKLNLSSKQVSTFDLFSNADVMNPLVDNKNENLYFLADVNGFRNLYGYSFATQKISQLTNFYTGISGITMFSPAVSIATKSNKVVYNHFDNGYYAIVSASVADFEPIENKPNTPNGGILFSNSFESGRNIVQQQLDAEKVKSIKPLLSLSDKKYIPNFKIEYLANSGLGVSTSQFGTGMGGGVTALFGDMLNYNQLAGTVALNGEIQDFGGQAFYLNQKGKIQWGGSISHIPYRFFGGTDYSILDTLGSQNGLSFYNAKVNQRIFRLFIDDVSFFAYKPLNKYKRLEAGYSFRKYWFSLKEYPTYAQIGTDLNGYIQTYNPYASERPQKVDNAEAGFVPFTLNQLHIAYVGDNSVFGTTAPLKGYRYRFELAKYFGKNGFNSITADYRRYIYLKPATLAVRGLYMGRLSDNNLAYLDQILPLYIGFPWYMHGFYGRAFSQQYYDGLITQDMLQGNQIGVANFETRFPFLGPEKLALIKMNFLPTDLNFFFDTGMAWGKNKTIGQDAETIFWNGEPIKYTVKPIVSTGLSLRINVLGYLILEPYFAVPFYNGKKNPVVTGVNFMVPGW